MNKKFIIHDILCNFFVQPVHTAKIMTMNWKAQRVQWIFESNIVKYLLLYSMIHFYNRHTEIANCFLHSSIFSPHSKGNTLEGSHICQERRSENSEFRKTKCKRINIQNVMHNVQWELFFSHSLRHFPQKSVQWRSNKLLGTLNQRTIMTQIELMILQCRTFNLWRLILFKL